MNDNDLNGTERFVSDGLVSPDECKTLLHLAKKFGEVGDGYEGKISPHSKNEQFQGLTIGKAALLAYSGKMDGKLLELYLKITEQARQYLISIFRLKQKLYFTYTHLVCRSALSSGINRTDFSHSIHADNCNILQNGFCSKTFPSYTWRDYSAIVYLNHEFKGGEFIFSADDEGNKVQSSIKPKCGRMVGFSSGGENLHGVRAVRQGTRCAIALWFTFDKNHLEPERIYANELLHNYFYN